MSTTSATLLARLAKNNDQVSWERFVERYWRLVYWVTRRAGLPAAEAEEVVQEVFCKLVVLMPAFEYDPARGRFRAYVRTLTERHINDRVRSGAACDRAIARLQQGLTPAPTGELDAIWDQEWRRSRVMLALDAVAAEVEPCTFQAFQLVAVQGWSPKRAAKFLELSIDSVYQAKSRVTARLREHLADLMREE